MLDRQEAEVVLMDSQVPASRARVSAIVIGEEQKDGTGSPSTYDQLSLACMEISAWPNQQSTIIPIHGLLTFKCHDAPLAIKGLDVDLLHVG